MARFWRPGGRSVRPSLTFNAASGALPAGFTLTRATKGTYFDSSGTLQEAANNIPRFSYDPILRTLRGLLIEDQSTNGTTNPRFEGGTTGVLGSGGVLPTGYISAPSNQGTVTANILAITTENGVPCIEVRFQGTTAGAGYWTIFAPGYLAAVQNQVVTSTFYCRWIAGTLPSTAQINIEEYTSGLAFLAADLTSFNPHQGPLVSQRYSHTRTMANATTAFARTLVSFNWPSAQAVDFTVRIGAPQLELTHFPTSVILPPVGSPAAATRNRDDVTSLNPTWLAQGVGTIIAESDHNDWVRFGSATANYARVFGFANAAGTNALSGMCYKWTSGFYCTDNSVSQASLSWYGTDFRGPQRMAYAWAPNDFAFTKNGDPSLLTDNAGTIPTFDRCHLGSDPNGINWKTNGHIRYFYYYPCRLSNAQMIALSTPATVLDWRKEQLALPNGFSTTRASKACYFDSAGVLQEAANNTPRFDYDPVTLALKGLLIEAQSTNSIADPRFEDTAGPWGLPTGWGVYFPGGLTFAIVGRGTEFGMSYIDARYSGTATGAGAHNISPPNVAAASGQTWTMSIGARIVGGSKTNVAEVSVRPTAVDAGLAYLAEIANNFVASLDSTFRRFSQTYASLPASTAFVGGPFTLRAAAAGPVDITIRWYIPQLEQGMLSSPILPPAGAPAAATRSMDYIACNTASWVPPGEVTILAEIEQTFTATTGYQNRFWSISKDTGTAEKYQVHVQSPGIAQNVYSGGATQVLSTPAVTWPGVKKAAAAFKTNNFSISVNGDACVTDNAGTMPSGVNRVQWGIGAAGTNWPLNGWLRQWTLYPARLLDAQLQEISK